MARPTLLAALLVAALVGCNGSDDPSTATVVTTARATPLTTSPATTTMTPPATTVPATPSSTDPTPPSAARAALALVVGWLNGDPIDERDYTRRFTPAFVEQVPFTAFRPILDELVAGAPWRVDGEPEEPRPGALAATLANARDERFGLELMLADPASPVMDSLLMEPSVDPPESAEEAHRQLNAQGTLRLVTAEVGDGACSPTEEIRADEVMPLGSVFKLYVLGAVVEAIAGGTLSWDTPVTIRDELDSIPSGTTQDEPAGSSLSVRELATRMISISDNTATDHLIDLVGRRAVEDALLTYGHATPRVTLPFLTTRELTILKFSSDELLERYAAASIRERRRLLGEEVSAAPLPPISNIVTAAPTAVEQVEWFASPLDVCRALHRLGRNGEARSILAVNPGVAADAGRWEYVGFKGGSEPGVLAVAWLVADDRGRQYVLAGGLANDTTPIPEPTAVAAFGYLRDQMGD